MDDYNTQHKTAHEWPDFFLDDSGVSIKWEHLDPPDRDTLAAHKSASWQATLNTIDAKQSSLKELTYDKATGETGSGTECEKSCHVKRPHKRFVISIFIFSGRLDCA